MKGVISKLIDMLWFANEKSKEFEDAISSTSVNEEQNYFFVEIEKKFYKITVEEA